jgi:hypothetical protein
MTYDIPGDQNKDSDTSIPPGHESIQFELSKGIKEKIKDIFFDHKCISIYVKTDGTRSKAFRSKVYLSSMRATLEQFDKKIDGAIDPSTKLLCVYSLKYHLRKYIKFDDDEQKWYSENFPDDPSNPKSDGTTNHGDKKKPNTTQLVLEIAKASYSKLFVDEYRVPHAALSINGHLEVTPIRSRKFRNCIAANAYRELGIVIDGQTINNIIGVLGAEAEFNNEEVIRLDLRVAARIVNNKVVWYIDLTNKYWEFVEVSSEGWRIVNNIIIFRRFTNQLPQVYPCRDYPSDIMDKFIKLLLGVNVKEEYKEDYWLLLKCYIICALIPDIPKPVLMPNGHQGGAKSSLMESIKTLIDPSIINTLSFPHDVNQLIQQLSHNYVAYYDNISKLPDWISDEICRAVTGSGSSKRVLYSDDDDFIYNLRRCVGLNGVNLAATKPDILDRALNFRVKRIADEDRRLEADVKKEVEAMRPQLLGYILDILVAVLKWKEQAGGLGLKQLPRLADFGEYGEMVSRCMGNKAGEFLKAYQNNVRLQIEEIVESSQVATCLVYWFSEIWSKNTVERKEEQQRIVGNTKDDDAGWKGTATELLQILENAADTLKVSTNSRLWPKSPSSLSRRLNEIAVTMKEIGISVEFVPGNRGKVRNIIVSEMSSSSSSSQDEARNKSKKDDRIDDDKKVSSQTPSSNSNKVRAQLKSDDGMYGDDGILHTDTNDQSIWTCPRCNEVVKGLYWKKHHDCERKN